MKTPSPSKIVLQIFALLALASFIWSVWSETPWKFVTTGGIFLIASFVVAVSRAVSDKQKGLDK